MKTYEQFQKLDNEVIEKAKMSITIKAELDGETYRENMPLFALKIST